MRKLIAVLITSLAVTTLVLPSHAAKFKVVDNKGKPVSKANVLAGWGMPSQTLQADAKGEFQFPEKPGTGGEWCMVVVKAEGYAYASAMFSPNSKDNRTFTLQPEKKLKGKVVDENGKPVAGARVSLTSLQAADGSPDGLYMQPWKYGDGEERAEAAIDDVTTAADGSFVIRHLPDPANVRFVDFSLETTANGRALVSQYGGEVELGDGVTITLPRECKVEARVYAPDGTLATGGLIFSVPGSGWTSADGRSKIVGKDGKFTLGKLTPDKHSLILANVFEYDYDAKKPTGAKSSWVMPAVSDIDMSPDKVTTLDLRLIDGVLLKGKVFDIDTGEAFKAYDLIVSHAGRPGRNVGAFLSQARGISGDGEFSIYVPPGKVDITPSSIGDGADRVSYQDESERPHLIVDAVAGQDQTNLELKVTRPVDEFAQRGKGATPIPADFALTPGSYKLTWDPNGAVDPYTNGQLYSSTDARMMALKMPKLGSENALIYARQLDGDDADGVLLYVIDESKGTGSGYDRAYIDRNRNRDLTDDTPLTLVVDGLFLGPEGAWTEVQSRQGPRDGEHTNYPISVQVKVENSNGRTYATLRSKGGWNGIVDTSKGKVKCCVVDANVNGIYGELVDVDDDCSLRSVGDRVYVDTNGCGAVVMEFDSRHRIVLNESTLIAGKPYTVRVSANGDTLTVSEYTKPMGTLVVTAAKMKPLEARFESVCLIGKSGLHEFGDMSKPISLPAGSYRFSQCELLVKQNNGKSIRFSCTPGAVVTVKAGQQTTLDLGGKLTLRGIEPEKNVVYLIKGSSSAAGWYMNFGDINVSRIDGTGDYFSYRAQATLYDKAGKLVYTKSASYT